MSSEATARNRPGRRMAVVEMIGMPGAGKTTVCAALVEMLREQGLDAATTVSAARRHAGRTLAGRAIARLAPPSLRRGLLWGLFYLLGIVHALLFLRENPTLTRGVLSAQLRRPISRSLKRHVLFWFFQLGGRRRFLDSTAHGREALVLDDGFLHRSVHLNSSHLEEPDPQRIADYIGLLPKPDLVVFVSATTATCERRVRQRGVWAHSRRLTAVELSRYIANARQAVDSTLVEVCARGWPVIEINNDGRDLEVVRLDLRSRLTHLLVGVDRDRRMGAMA